MADLIKKPTGKVGLVKLIAEIDFNAEASVLEALASFFPTMSGVKSL